MIMKNMKNKVLTGLIGATILVGSSGCNSTNTTPAIELQTQASLTTSAFLIAIDKDDRVATAKKIYELSNLVENLVDNGVSLDDIKTFAINYAVQSVDSDERAAIESLVNSIVDYLHVKIGGENANLTLLEKNELIKAAIHGVKQSVEPFAR